MSIGVRERLGETHVRSRWLPSQKGGFFVALQPQKRAFMEVAG